MSSNTPATGTEKQSANFAVSSRKIVAESADVQVKEFLLVPGEEVPWHHHSAVFDVFYCLAGTLTERERPVAYVRLDYLAQSESFRVDDVSLR